MDLDNYFKSLKKNHKKKTQTGFEKNDRRTFIEEVLGQLGYSKENIYEDVPQKGKTPDLRIYGDTEKKSKDTMSRFIIETKNYGSLDKNINNIDFQQLKNYVRRNIGKIEYIASTDYISLFLFKADALIKEKKIDLDKERISSREKAGFKNVLVREFDFTDFSAEDEQKIEMLSHKNLFEIYNFPDPEKNVDRFDIENSSVRENFIKSLYNIMEEIKSDVSVKFESELEEFLEEYKAIDSGKFDDQFMELVYKDKFFAIRNLFLWAIEMNYISNFFKEKNDVPSKENIDRILTEKNPEGNDYFYNEYLITCIYSIINKTLFIRILEDSGFEGQNIFIDGEEKGRYLSNGIVNKKFLNGKLKEYISYIFQFKNKDLQKFDFLLKHDIYDWIIDEMEEHTLVDFLRVFNEIYLKRLDQDILGDIYEHYLQEERDEERGKSYRRLLGQYYTPRPLVRLMWFLVREVLKQEKNRDLYSENKELLQILDPFMGSGTFLNESVLHMKQSYSGKKIRKGEVFKFFTDRRKDRKIEDSLYGFEKNPLSCSIADINVYFRLIKSFNSEVLKNIPVDDLKLFRTNSFDLDYENKNNNTMQLNLLAEEIRNIFSERREIKEAKTKSYDIIISNPPYGIISPNAFMKKSLIPFAYPEYNFDKNENEIDFTWDNVKKGKIPKIEQNRGKLRDMYAFAYGVADRLAKDEGIICFITSNTFLTLPTYKWMRKYWLKNYTIKYIVNFNRVMEKSNSMFSPESSISTAVIAMVKKKPERNYKIKYLDISNLDSIKEKYDYFNDIEWRTPAKDKRDIESFKTKQIKDLDFFEVDRDEFLSNRDYEFIKMDPVVKKIEERTDFLLNFGDFQLGIITSNDDVFVNDSKKTLLKNVKEYVEKNNIDYSPKESFIRKFIRHKNLQKYGLTDVTYTYYDKRLEKLVHKKARSEGSYSPMRFRDKNKMNKQFKLLVGAYYFYVDENNFVMDQNCIDKKNLYFLVHDNKDVLYYICGILNSKLGEFYRYKTQIDNYERFPIKKIEGNEDKFKYISKEVKKIHKLKSDYKKLKNGNTNFETNFFNENISNKIESYPIEEENEYFNLEIPKGIGDIYFIENPKISEEDKRIIELNNNGLKLICKNKDIAKMIFEKHLKDSYGHLNDMDINILITRMDEERYNKIIQKIDKQIQKTERNIDLMVYALYFDTDIKYVNGRIKNYGEILSDKNVKKIEKVLK